MKKFIVNILVFFFIVAVIDVTVGKLLWYLQSEASGRTGYEYYACKESNEDIIIMGSSRASHHYVPQIITDSLGMSCYNAGQDGNGIIMQYGRWLMISERYTPKFIIYDVNPSFDLCVNDNMTYVDRLKPFCHDTKVKQYVSELFPLERLKLFSQMYRYNYKFIEMASDYTKSSEINNRGYIPLTGMIRKEIVSADRPIKKLQLDEDEVKIKYILQLAEECKNKEIRLIFVASPAFRGDVYTKDSFTVINKISEEYGSPFLYYFESDYSEDPELFKDSHHLNENGAQIFTSEIANQIIKYISLQ